MYAQYKDRLNTRKFVNLVIKGRLFISSCGLELWMGLGMTHLLPFPKWLLYFVQTTECARKLFPLISLLAYFTFPLIQLIVVLEKVFLTLSLRISSSSLCTVRTKHTSYSHKLFIDPLALCMERKMDENFWGPYGEISMNFSSQTLGLFWDIFRDFRRGCSKNVEEKWRLLTFWPSEDILYSKPWIKRLKANRK